MLVVLTSTVAILSISPFFAAVAMEASPPKGINPNKIVAVDEPDFVADFTEFPVAVKPVVTEQLENAAAIARINKVFFILI